jgi:hypothetical protein
LTIDESYKSNNICTMARVLVNLKTKDGLFNSTYLVCGSRKFSKTMDYMNVPFCCVQCHKVGHLLKEYPLKYFQKKWVTKGSKVDVLQSDDVGEKSTIQIMKKKDLCLEKDTIT